MALEGKIYSILSGATALTALVGTAIYPDHKPQESTNPSVIYSRVSGIRDYVLEGYSGLEHARIQFDIYSTNIDGRRQVTDQVITAMEASTTFTSMAISSPIDDYDDIVGLYRRIQDFSVWNHD